MIGPRAIQLGGRVVERLLVDERSVLEPPTHHARHRRAVGARVRVRQVDPAVRRVVRVRRHVEQPALALRPHLRQARHRLRQQLALLDDPQPAGLLGDEHPPVGQERDRPGRLEPLAHQLELELVLLARDDGVAQRLREHRLRAPRAVGLLADEDDHGAHGLVVQERGEGRHAVRGMAVADRGRQARVVAAVLPDVVEQALRLAALELGAVAGRAVCAKTSATLPDRSVWAATSVAPLSRPAVSASVFIFSKHVLLFASQPPTRAAPPPARESPEHTRVTALRVERI